MNGRKQVSNQIESLKPLTRIQTHQILDRTLLRKYTRWKKQHEEVIHPKGKGKKRLITLPALIILTVLETTSGQCFSPDRHFSLLAFFIASFTPFRICTLFEQLSVQIFSIHARISSTTAVYPSSWVTGVCSALWECDTSMCHLRLLLNWISALLWGCWKMVSKERKLFLFCF